MPGIPREMIEHKLGIDPAFKPIKQKERKYTTERCETIQLEVNRLLEAGFIRPVDYPSWLANPVLIEKPDGSWRMCIDHTSLNKACPKDEYPCPLFARSWTPRHRVNFYHFWTPIQAITKSASPLMIKKKQRSSHRSGFSVTLRGRSVSRTGELHIKNVYAQSWKVKLRGTSKLTLMI
jgi:hypothetical protein